MGFFDLFEILFPRELLSITTKENKTLRSAKFYYPSLRFFRNFNKIPELKDSPIRYYHRMPSLWRTRVKGWHSLSLPLK